MPDRSKAPGHRTVPQLSLPPEQQTVLANGATLHIYEGGDQPVTTLRVVFDGGVAESPNPALQPIYSQIVTEGTKSKLPLEVSEELDYNGGRYSPVVDGHHTGFRLGMLSRRAVPLIELMREIYTGPRFGQKELTAIKTGTIAQIKYRDRQMPVLAMRGWAEMVFGAGHYSAGMAEEADVKAVTTESLQNFHSELCCAKGCHAYLSGTVNDEIVAACSDFLLSFDNSREPLALNVQPYCSTPAGMNRVERDYAQQSALKAGFALPIRRDHADYHTLRLAVMALGGYFGSRLMRVIREEQGLTYGISASLCSASDGTYMQIGAQCSHDKVDAVLTGIAEQMRKLATDPPQGHELERLRMHTLTEALETLDNPDAIMGQYIMRRTVGLPADYFARQQQAIAELTAEAIAEMATRYLNPDKLRICIAGR